MKKNRLTIIVFLIFVGVATWLWYSRSSNSTIKGDLRDFVVDDTASINKLFLADREGRSSLLTRATDGKWLVNGKYPARQESINNLLETIKTLEVRSPVGKNLYNNTMKLMASKSVKIEIYQKDNLVKTYYVGHPTMDNLGTFMYLQGSTVPYIMHIPGFNGFLSTRYIANPEDWRERGVFRFDPRTIVNINIEDIVNDSKSFSLTRNQDSTYSLNYTKPFKALPGIDVLKVRKFLELFSKTYYERIETKMPKLTLDSILHTKPFAQVSVTNDRNYTKKIVLFKKPVVEGAKLEFDVETGKRYEFDKERFYTLIEGDTSWFICQYQQFNKFLIDPLNLTKTPSGQVIK